MSQAEGTAFAMDQREEKLRGGIESKPDWLQQNEEEEKWYEMSLKKIKQALLS